MPPTTIRSPPALESFTSLADHQSRTPASFFGANPVLHYHGPGGRALVQRDQAAKLPIFSSPDTPLESNGAEEDSPTPIAEAIDIFVSSEYVCLALIPLFEMLIQKYIEL